MKRNNIENIGIIKLESIGDIIHTLPAAYMLRENFPDPKNRLDCGRKSYEVLTR